MMDVPLDMQYVDTLINSCVSPINRIKCSCYRVRQAIVETLFEHGVGHDKEIFTGSQFEGMRKEVCGDMDKMIVTRGFPIIQCSKNIPAITGYCMLTPKMRTSGDPAYLGLVIDDNNLSLLPESFKPCIAVYEHKRYLKSENFVSCMKGYPEEYTAHGPAMTGQVVQYNTKYGMADLVYCLSCNGWPNCAEQFFQRLRPAGWPPKEAIDNIRLSKCYVVAVGPHLIEPAEKSLLWRWSFSVAERQLMHGMNDAMAGCTFILKTLKKVSFEDGSNVVVSYYLKTACFWVFEKYGPEDDSSILGLACRVLEWLIVSYRKHHLPHYFIPEQNLIGHLTSEDCNDTISNLEHLKLNICVESLKALVELIPDAAVSFKQTLQSADISTDTTFELEDYQNFLRADNFKPALKTSMKREGKGSAKIIAHKRREYAFWLFQYEVLDRSLDKEYANIEIETLQNITDVALKQVLDDLVNLVDEVEYSAFKSTLYRDFADFSYALAVHCRSKISTDKVYSSDWHNAACYLKGQTECMLQAGVPLQYPDGWSDGGLSGKVGLARFYYLERDMEKLGEVMIHLRPLLADVLENPDILQYLCHSTVTVDLKLSVIPWSSDTVLYKQLTEERPQFARYINFHCATLGFYILGRYALWKDNREVLKVAENGLEQLQPLLTRASFKATNWILLRILLDHFA